MQISRRNAPVRKTYIYISCISTKRLAYKTQTGLNNIFATLTHLNTNFVNWLYTKLINVCLYILTASPCLRYLAYGLRVMLTKQCLFALCERTRYTEWICYNAVSGAVLAWHELCHCVPLSGRRTVHRERGQRTGHGRAKVTIKMPIYPSTSDCYD